MFFTTEIVMIIAKRLEQKLIQIADARQVQRSTHRKAKARENLVRVTYASTVMVSRFPVILICSEFIVNIEERVFKFPVTSVLSKLGTDTNTMFIELFKILKDMSFFEECSPFKIRIEISRTQMDRSTKCTHFVDVRSYVPQAVSDNVYNADRRLFAFAANIACATITSRNTPSRSPIRRPRQKSWTTKC